MHRINKTLSFDAVMMGSEEDCKDVQVEIGMKNPETKKVFFQSTFNPRPITSSNSDELCLAVKQAIITRFGQYHHTEKAFHYRLSVKVHTL